MAIDTVASPEGGPNAYAVGIQGDFLAPELCDGDIAVFDPDAGSGLRHAIVAVSVAVFALIVAGCGPRCAGAAWAVLTPNSTATVSRESKTMTRRISAPDP